MAKHIFLVVSTLLSISMSTHGMYHDGIKICPDGTYLNTQTGQTGKFDLTWGQASPTKNAQEDSQSTQSEEDAGYIAEDEDLKKQLGKVTFKQIIAETDTESTKEKLVKPIAVCLMRAQSSAPKTTESLPTTPAPMHGVIH